MIVLLNKPFQVLCQFSDTAGRRTLQAFVPMPLVYPAGRLDYDSEGLVVLTDDGRIQSSICDPRRGLAKTYWAQVEGRPDAAALEALRRGVVLPDGGTRPAGVRVLSEAPDIWPRDPPIRVRKHIPTVWLELVIREGRNRQVRRMTAAVGHPTLRLVRVAIGPFTVAGLAPGESSVVEQTPVIARASRQGGRRGSGRRPRDHRPGAAHGRGGISP